MNEPFSRFFLRIKTTPPLPDLCFTHSCLQHQIAALHYLLSHSSSETVSLLCFSLPSFLPVLLAHVELGDITSLVALRILSLMATISTETSVHLSLLHADVVGIALGIARTTQEAMIQAAVILLLGLCTGPCNIIASSKIAEDPGCLRIVHKLINEVSHRRAAGEVLRCLMGSKEGVARCREHSDEVELMVGGTLLARSWKMMRSLVKPSHLGCK